jgi:FMN-dependent oxidoreductase (nitrilotriacetate monooxygenase family)
VAGTSQPSDRARLFLSVGVNSTGYHAKSWQAGSPPDRFLDIGYYRDVAEIAHAATLDALFLSDHPALQEDGTSRPLHSLDPLILFSALAEAVPDIGLIATASTAFNSPYNLARRLATLDLISGGRAGWNAVSTFNPRVAANCGTAPIADHDTRYRRTEEFLQVVTALWDSWQFNRQGRQDGQDGPAGPHSPDLLWPPGSIHELNHHGEFFDVRGPLNVPPSPQGHPVIAQAGGSPQGRRIAALYGEIIYTAQLSKNGAQRFANGIKDQARQAGRPPGAIKVMPGLVPVIGSTAAEAERNYQQLIDLGGVTQNEVSALAGRLDLDPADLDLDAPLTEEQLRPRPGRVAPEGFFNAIADLARDEGLTVRELARRVEGGHRLVVGTPDEVAEAILDWWRDGAADGFTLQPSVLPRDLTTFATEVLPLLQKQGVFPSHYTEPTLRERFGFPRPASEKPAPEKEER